MVMAAKKHANVTTSHLFFWLMEMNAREGNGTYY